jgi:aspartyl protease family protein
VTGDEIARLAVALLVLALLIGLVAGRRSRLGQSLRMALSWVGIFLGVYLLFLFRDDLSFVWERVAGDVGVTQAPTVVGNTTRIPMARDGHFWVEGRVDGVAVRFLVDSGATVSAISTETATRAGLDVRRTMPVVVNTANGAVPAYPARVGMLQVGSIRQPNARVLVGDSFGRVNVLGMNFLTDLKSWRVERRVLILEP